MSKQDKPGPEGASIESAGDVIIGGDVVGRDKIEINIETFVTSGKPRLLTSKQRLQAAISSRQARRFWEPFIDGELQIVLGRFFEFATFEPTGFMGSGDALALSELRAFFDILDFPDFNIAYADKLSPAELTTNLIVLGGPDGNAIAAKLVPSLANTIRFGDPSRYVIALTDSLTGAVFVPTSVPGSKRREIAKDYGLIIKAPNPFAPSKQLMLVAGSFGYGTWAGIRFVISQQFLENSPVSGDKSLECLIETEILNGAPQVVRSLVIRAL